ncbi:MAG: hypothetical protein FWG79_07950 [Bacteroidales bacterium]|nr:hypothetical protein [Bacteroidales bacterium]
MNKLKKIGLIAGIALCLTANPTKEAQAQTFETDAPVVNIRTGTEFKLSHIRIWRFRLYNKVGAVVMPIKSSIYYDYGEYSSTPIWEPTFATGTEISISRRNKLVVEQEYGFRTKAEPGRTLYGRFSWYIGWKYNLELLGQPNFSVYINMFNEHGYRLDSYGYEFGLDYKREIRKNLSLTARTGCSVGESGSVIFHVSAGLHYRIPPLGQPNIELPSWEREPKQKVKRPNPRNTQIPCYSYPNSKVQERHVIFNRP